MIMTRKAVSGKPNRILSGYCVVVAENHEGKIKLFGKRALSSSSSHPFPLHFLSIQNNSMGKSRFQKNRTAVPYEPKIKKSAPL